MEFTSFAKFEISKRQTIQSVRRAGKCLDQLIWQGSDRIEIQTCIVVIFEEK